MIYFFYKYVNITLFIIMMIISLIYAFKGDSDNAFICFAIAIIYADNWIKKDTMDKGE